MDAVKKHIYPGKHSDGRGRVNLNTYMGKSSHVRQVESKVQKVAPTDYSVVIQGETGVGKELVARAIHSCSQRAHQAFVALDCATIPDTLLESELFGYEKGAFTGAGATRKGYFTIADGGTVFLDEVTNLSSEAQKKLLRTIQEREVHPLGGEQSVEFDVRFLVASNIPLENSVDSGEFRRDLYYRLNEFSIYIPPLRKRKEDICYLAHRFLSETSLELGKEIDSFSNEAMMLLQSHSYPGNARELKNIIKHAALVCGKRVEGDDLLFLSQEKSKGGLTSEELADLDKGLSMKEIARREAEEVERRLINHALKKCGGNKSKACRLLKIDYKTLHIKMKVYDITS